MGKVRPLHERQRLPVVFQYPDGTQERFKLEDEVECGEKHSSGEYLYLIQLLSDDRGEELLRMPYYRRPVDGDDSAWNFAGRGAITTYRSYWVELFAAALEKDWFKSIIEEASARVRRVSGNP